MTLIYDDYNDWWVWVDVDNHDNDLSPHFDYEEDAIQWYGRISKHIFEKYSITKNENS
jgi:phage-related protein